jgi:murein DD-endopeptidase MepM/ murein hydrolase activator NlpD
VCVWFAIVFSSGDQIGNNENTGFIFKHWVNVSTNYKHLSRIEVRTQTHVKATVLEYIFTGLILLPLHSVYRMIKLLPVAWNVRL